jgi:hypothetical protein
VKHAETDELQPLALIECLTRLEKRVRLPRSKSIGLPMAPAFLLDSIRGALDLLLSDQREPGGYFPILRVTTTVVLVR